ncbi:hypothetical protein C8Q76DRAFT_795240 [Earliella scabrosa]|nr:hypothetical protein C8Q76DRAFT_795240 [Earliella scabrosa]
MPACAKFKKSKDGNAKKKNKCRDCNRSKKSHERQRKKTPPTVSSILQKYSVDSLQPLTSDADARKEMSAGFRPSNAPSASQASSSKRSSQSQHAASGKSKSKKSSGKVGPPPSRMHQLRYIIVNPCGLWQTTSTPSRVVLQSDCVPSTAEEELYREEAIRLLVTEDLDGNALAFSADWSTAAFDGYLRRLFPVLFEYLDLAYGVRDGTDDMFHWRMVRRSYTKAILYGKTLVDGRDLLECRLGATTKNKENFGLMVVTRHYISPAVYNNWDDAIKEAKARNAEREELPVDELEIEPESMTSNSDSSGSEDEDQRDYAPSDASDGSSQNQTTERDDRPSRSLNSNGKRPAIDRSRSRSPRLLVPSTPPPSQKRLHKRRRVGASSLLGFGVCLYDSFSDSPTPQDEDIDMPDPAAVRADREGTVSDDAYPIEHRNASWDIPPSQNRERQVSSQPSSPPPATTTTTQAALLPASPASPPTPGVNPVRRSSPVGYGLRSPPRTAFRNPWSR